MPGIYKEALKDTPKEVMNWRLFYGVFGRSNSFRLKSFNPTDLSQCLVLWAPPAVSMRV